MNRWLWLRRLRGPLFLILLGILALLSQWGILSLRRSWPILLIGWAALLLAERAASYRLPASGGWAPRSRPSTVGPALLIAAGALALLVEMGTLNPNQIWDWYLRWWPILLIAIGLIAIVEWRLDRAQPYGVRHRYGGIVVLVILLILAAHAVRGAGNWRVFSNEDGNTFIHNLFGRRYEARYALNQTIPASASIVIQAPRGDVTITRAADGRIHVQTDASVYADNASDAQQALAALQPQLMVNGGDVLLRAPQGNGRTDLTVALPSVATASIVAGHGNVTVQGIAAPVNVTAAHGDVSLEHVNGSAQVRMNRGGFSAQMIGGDLTLTGRVNDVAISDVQGSVSLNGDILREMRIARAGGVDIHSRRTDVQAAGLPGVITLGSGRLKIDGANGPLKIAARAKDIECSAIAGDVEIENRNGDISLTSTAQPGRIHIENHNGDIHLELPRNAKFQMTATAKIGAIHSQFGFAVNRSGSGQTVFGQEGSGGAKIDLTAEHGDIRIGRADAVAVTARASSVPASTAKAVKSIRRLRELRGVTPRVESQ